MADVADRAEIEEFQVEARIRSIRNKGREIYPKGVCCHCEEPFVANSLKLFCDSDCSKDYELGK